MKRNCEICESENFDKIYKQKFFLVGNQSSNYTVVTCQNCGFVYASNLPTQKKLNQFYKKNNKYSYHHNQGVSPDYMKRFYLNSFIIINNYFKNYYKEFDKSQIKILDIGCATGYLLSFFKKNYYTNLTGIDPAPECRLAAKKLFDLNILSQTLSEYKIKEKYDLIIFSSVLEHISDLAANLSLADKLLKDQGLMFISVPDGNNFGKIIREPFLEFSLEHINYFTRRSLKNLLLKYGITNLKYESYQLDIYGGYALNSLWKKNKQKNSIIYDEVGKRKIISYIKKSSKKLETINNKIKKLIKSKEKIIVWGVGSLTSRLLATTDLKKTNIQFFVDSNANLQGKTINNLPVKSPDILRNQKITVFVSTYIYGNEIKKILLKKYNFKGKTILL